MRDYHGSLLGIGQEHPSDHHVNRELRRVWYTVSQIDTALRELGPAALRITNNQQPNGSGSAIAPPFDMTILNDYVLMPGRAADQIVNALAATNVALTARGTTAQSADIFRIQSVSGSNWLRVAADGQTTLGSSTTAGMLNLPFNAGGTNLRSGTDGSSGMLLLRPTSTDMIVDCTNSSAVTRTQFQSVTNYQWVFNGTTRLVPKSGDTQTNVTLLVDRVSAGQTGDMAQFRDESAVVMAHVTKDGYYETRQLLLDGSTSGTITIKPPAAPTSHTLTLPAAPVAGGSLQTDAGGILSWVVGAATTIAVDKNGTLVGTRGTLNFIEGTNVTLTVADNAGAGRVDVTIASTTGAAGPVTSVSAAYTALSTDSIILANGTFAVTLLSAVTAGSGHLLEVKNVGTGIVTVLPAGAETIDGDSSMILLNEDAIDLVSDGSNWQVV